MVRDIAELEVKFYLYKLVVKFVAFIIKNIRRRNLNLLKKGCRGVKLNSITPRNTFRSVRRCLFLCCCKSKYYKGV